MSVDSLIRDIDRLGGRKELEQGTTLALTLDRLWWPPNRSENGGAEFAALTETLSGLRNRLRSEAIDGGWEVS